MDVKNLETLLRKVGTKAPIKEGFYNAKFTGVTSGITNNANEYIGVVFEVEGFGSQEFRLISSVSKDGKVLSCMDKFTWVSNRVAQQIGYFDEEVNALFYTKDNDKVIIIEVIINHVDDASYVNFKVPVDIISDEEAEAVTSFDASIIDF